MISRLKYIQNIGSKLIRSNANPLSKNPFQASFLGQNYKLPLTTFTGPHQIKPVPNRRLLKGLGIILGTTIIGYAFWSYNEDRNADLNISMYRKVPLNAISRAWGEFNSIDLPVWFRKPGFYLYSWIFNCNLNEVETEDLTKYKNLSEFFRRGLKPGARTIDTNSCITSPSDGKILHFGKVEQGFMEQVKGVNYSLKDFLGEQNWPTNKKDVSYIPEQASPFEDDSTYHRRILYNPDNSLYHCVIYLGPGDYHRFHSPTEWNIYFRRHFTGELFSVNPSVARWLKGLFNLNERAVYYGEWKHGFFSMAAVGATNVGSIKINMDKDLETNSKRKPEELIGKLDKSFCEQPKHDVKKNTKLDKIKGVEVHRGDDFGEFNLGSTIVLIFEAPSTFEFNIKPNQRILYGSQLGNSVPAK